MKHMIKYAHNGKFSFPRIGKMLTIVNYYIFDSNIEILSDVKYSPL